MKDGVVLFGGAFDPPHVGHTLVIEQVLKQVKPEELWLLPCYRHTFQKNLTASQHRVKMAELFVEEIGNDRVKLNTIEFERRSDGSTYQTWLWLKELYPQTTFSFVMGSDNLPSFEKWRHWQELQRVMQFYVYIRKGYPAKPWYKSMMLLQGKEVSEVSSTQVRDRIKGGKPIDDLIPKKVAAYIWEHELYR